LKDKDKIPKWATRNSLLNLIYKTFRMLKNEGLRQTLFAIGYTFKRASHMRRLKKKLTLSRRERERQRTHVFKNNYTFSVVVPLYNTKIRFLKDMVESLERQTYENWQLCLADGSDENHKDVEEFCLMKSGGDSRIKYKKLEKNEGIAGNTNAAIEMAEGDFISFLDHDDFLADNALFEVAKAVEETSADFIYTDEIIYTGKLNIAGNMHLKPDFSPDYLRSCNYICHLTTVSRGLLERTGMMDSEMDGSQDYDFVLRATESADKIHHIDELLYYWRVHEDSVASSIDAKPYAYLAAKKAVERHLDRVGLKGEVIKSIAVPMLHINYVIEGNPLISIIIPTSDHTDVLKKCIDSIFELSSYENFEIILVENNSKNPETFEYYESLSGTEKIKILYYEGGFNFSAINNFASKTAEGEHLLFLNNDIEVISPDWLEQMVMFSQRSDVGAVGIKLLYPDDTVQHGGIAVGVCGSAANLCPLFPRENQGYMSRLAVVNNLSAVTGACLMMKKSDFFKVGGFSEELAVSLNDVDLGLKLSKIGRYNVFNPVALAYHHESRSRGYDKKGEKRRRHEAEKEILRKKWPAYFEEKGDPFYNKNFGKNSVSYNR